MRVAAHAGIEVVVVVVVLSRGMSGPLGFNESREEVRWWSFPNGDNLFSCMIENASAAAVAPAQIAHTKPVVIQRGRDGVWNQ